MSNDIVYDVSIFIINKDMDYIFEDEYDKVDDGEGMFVCLTNDRLNSEFGDDNSICIYKRWMNKLLHTKERLKSVIDFEYKSLPQVSCQWQNNKEKLPNTYEFDMSGKTELPKKFIRHINNTNQTSVLAAHNKHKIWMLLQHLEGYMYTQQAMTSMKALSETYNIESRLPAIMTAYHTQIEIGGKRHNGYLPAIGQLMYISKHIIRIDDLLSKLTNGNGCLFGITDDGMNNLLDKWWSSTQFNDSFVWYMHSGVMNGFDKTECANVLPLYVLNN